MLDWIYTKIIAPYWTEFKAKPIRMSLLVVGCVLLVLGVLWFSAAVLGVNVGEAINGWIGQ